jgi:hypothetical protein
MAQVKKGIGSLTGIVRTKRQCRDAIDLRTELLPDSGALAQCRELSSRLTSAHRWPRTTMVVIRIH